MTCSKGPGPEPGLSLNMWYVLYQIATCITTVATLLGSIKGLAALM